MGFAEEVAAARRQKLDVERATDAEEGARLIGARAAIPGFRSLLAEIAETLIQNGVSPSAARSCTYQEQLYGRTREALRNEPAGWYLRGIRTDIWLGVDARLYEMIQEESTWARTVSSAHPIDLMKAWNNNHRSHYFANVVDPPGFFRCEYVYGDWTCINFEESVRREVTKMIVDGA